MRFDHADNISSQAVICFRGGRIGPRHEVAGYTGRRQLWLFADQLRRWPWIRRLNGTGVSLEIEIGLR